MSWGCEHLACQELSFFELRQNRSHCFWPFRIQAKKSPWPWIFKLINFSPSMESGRDDRYLPQIRQADRRGYLKVNTFSIFVLYRKSNPFFVSIPWRLLSMLSLHLTWIIAIPSVLVYLSPKRHAYKSKCCGEFPEGKEEI